MGRCKIDELLSVEQWFGCLYLKTYTKSVIINDFLRNVWYNFPVDS